MFVDSVRLEQELTDSFGGSQAESRVVVRQAVDLADAGRYEATVGTPLTTDLVIDELGDAPEGGPVERWNWWIGSLEVAFGGYERFAIRRYESAP